MILVEVGEADAVEVVEGQAGLRESAGGGGRSEAGVDEHGPIAVADHGAVAARTGAEHADAHRWRGTGPLWRAWNPIGLRGVGQLGEKHALFEELGHPCRRTWAGVGDGAGVPDRSGYRVRL